MQFNRVSEFIYSILSDLYGIQVVNYLDDFIVVAISCEEAEWAQNTVINTLRYFGFHISWAKVNPPAQVCRLLGLEIDSSEMEIRLPLDIPLGLACTCHESAQSQTGWWRRHSPPCM